MAEFRRSTDGAYIKPLPIIPTQYQWKNEMRTPSGQKSSEPENFSLNYEKFRTIFDAAAIGQYLGGVHAHGDADLTIGFINESCVFDCSKLKFEWRKDYQGRYVLVGIYDGEEFFVNNLHIHSKHLKLFYSSRRPLSATECSFRTGKYSLHQVQILEALHQLDCKV